MLAYSYRDVILHVFPTLDSLDVHCIKHSSRTDESSSTAAMAPILIALPCPGNIHLHYNIENGKYVLYYGKFG